MSDHQTATETVERGAVKKLIEHAKEWNASTMCLSGKVDDGWGVEIRVFSPIEWKRREKAAEDSDNADDDDGLSDGKPDAEDQS